MSTFLQKVTNEATDNVNRLTKLVGVKSMSAPQIPDGVGTIAGTAVGSYIGYKNGKHWLVGAVVGGSLGHNLPAVAMHPEERKAALGNLAGVGAAVVGWRMTGHNPLGFLLGYLAGRIGVSVGGLK